MSFCTGKQVSFFLVCALSARKKKKFGDCMHVIVIGGLPMYSSGKYE
jgi:hypothetical protein